RGGGGGRAGVVPAGSCQAGDESIENRIAILGHDDGNCRGGHFSGTRRALTASDDHFDLETHELDGERLRALAIAIRSAPFYSDIFSFDISQIAQSLTKGVGAS